MTNLRQELVSILTVLLVPTALVLVFPYEAIGFRPAKRPPRARASSAFVVLSGAEQEVAMRSAKASWQVDSAGARRLRADLAVGELPDDPSPVSLDAVIRPTRSSVSVIDCGPAAYPRSLAAPAPAPIAGDGKPEAREPAFPKSDLLKLE